MSYGYNSRYKNYEFSESLRTFSTESGANTYTEGNVATPVGRSNNLAMAIFQINVEFSGFDTIADGDKLEAQLTKNSKTEIVHIDNTDLIAARKIEFALVTSGMTKVELIKMINFARPKIYANSKIYVGMKSTGQAGANSVYIEILYVLRVVNPVIMNRALTD